MLAFLATLLPATATNYESCEPAVTLLLHPEAVNTSAFPRAPGGALGTHCSARLVPGQPIKDSRNPLFTEGTEAWDAFYDDGYPNVVLDPATGTGTFIAEIIDYFPPEKLQHKYLFDLFANEVSILPYYVATLNIEYTYWQKMK